LEIDPFGDITGDSMFLPLVKRELLCAARQKVTFQIRLWAGAIGLIIIFLMQSSRNIRTAPDAGLVLFKFMVFWLFIFAVFEGFRLTIDCISQERREGTLGFLFLSDLTGWDVVLGKLAANALPSLYALLALFPLLAVSLLFGGLLGEEFWRSCLVLVITLFYALSIGLWISTGPTDETQSLRAACLWATGLFVVPFGVRFLFGGHWLGGVIAATSPATALQAAFSKTYSSSPELYWGTLATVVLLGVLLLTSASRRLQATWQSDMGRSRRARPLFQALAPWIRPGGTRQAVPAEAPIVWLASRNHGNGWPAKVFAVLVPLLGLAVYAAEFDFKTWFGLLGLNPAKSPFLAYFMNPFNAAAISLFQIWFTVRCAMVLTEILDDRRLEELSSSGIGLPEIIAGTARALHREFLWPIIGLSSWLILGCFLNRLGLENWSYSVVILTMVGFIPLLLLPSTFNLVWFLAIRDARFTPVLLKTLLFRLLLPWGGLSCAIYFHTGALLAYFWGIFGHPTPKAIQKRMIKKWERNAKMQFKLLGSTTVVPELPESEVVFHDEKPPIGDRSMKVSVVRSTDGSALPASKSR
jgi:ABC-type transport system involved in multi-copper enzyme maturation permease subunit